MHKRRIFYRNARAHDNLELFFVSAVSSLLLLRFYLYLAGYPQIGGGSFHIAHMLWGGVLMLIAITSLLSFIGYRVQHAASFVGGVGFGVFIDELGKFITKNNNYFFRPTIGLIYAIFCAIYLSFNFISRKRQFTSEEFQLNALRQLEEAVVAKMSRAEREACFELLARADQKSIITKELRELVKRIKPVGQEVSLIQRAHEHVTKRYVSFWMKERSRYFIASLFVTVAAIFVIAISITIFRNIEEAKILLMNVHPYGSQLIIGQFVSSIAAAVYVILGVIKLASSRLEAIELFRRATLINVILTEFFIFSRIQFGAMPGFIVNLVLLIGLHWAIKQERNIGRTHYFQ